jgi:hypothetical protein
MVEEWKVGEKFEVIENKNLGYLRKNYKGICYGIASKKEKTIYFNPEKTKAIHIYRLKKLITIYELW